MRERDRERERERERTERGTLLCAGEHSLLRSGSGSGRDETTLEVLIENLKSVSL